MSVLFAGFLSIVHQEGDHGPSTVLNTKPVTAPHLRLVVGEGQNTKEEPQSQSGEPLEQQPSLHLLTSLEGS